jgi:NAD(P)-dependent dehydrogenase (short-subunit alcohol dehydrogenase family)
MVALTTIRQSNTLIPTQLPPQPTAVFVGATKGIGAITLRAWAQHTSALQPRTYIVGRPSAAATSVLEECKALCPNGSFQFVKADASLIREVDRACEEIKAKEQSLNLLFMSQGTLDMQSRTSEGLGLVAALTFYGRLRFMMNLVPLLKEGQGLRRVVSTFTGAKEGAVNVENPDLENVKIKSIEQVRGHGASLHTLHMESVSDGAPEVGFVHNFPGWVQTNLSSTMPGAMGVVFRIISPIMGYLKGQPAEEVGERHVFFATSKRFGGKGEGVTQTGLEQAKGTDGQVGSGMYSVDDHGEPGTAVELLAGMRKDGTKQKLWEHAMKVFDKVLKADGGNQQKS